MDLSPWRLTCHLVGLLSSTNPAVLGALGHINCQTVIYKDVETLFQFGDLCQPGCIVCSWGEDIQFAGQLTQRLLDHRSPLEVVFLAQEGEKRSVCNFAQIGDEDLSACSFDAACVLEAIERAFDASVRNQQCIAQRDATRKKLNSLTPAEREVADLMLAGLANKNVARRLDCSLRTVEARRKAIFEKLETRALVEIGAMIQDARTAMPDPLRTAPVGPHFGRRTNLAAIETFPVKSDLFPAQENSSQ